VDFDEAYDAVTHQIGNPPDKEEIPERGCIDPARTAAGLVEAGKRISDVARSGGRLVFATGHPGAMILYYLELARWAEKLGGEVVSPRRADATRREDRWTGPVRWELWETGPACSTLTIPNP
jgi:Phosphatase